MHRLAIPLGVAVVVLLVAVGAGHHRPTGPATVAGRFAAAFAAGRPVDAVATPALAARLGIRPHASALVRHVEVDDRAPDHVGVAVSVDVDGVTRTIEVEVVPTPAGWRVADVLL